MASSGRLSWILNQLAEGRSARCRLSTMPGKVNLHVCLSEKRVVGTDNSLLVAMLGAFAAQLDQHVVVDHGHKNSRGESHITFQLKSPTCSDKALESSDRLEPQQESRPAVVMDQSGLPPPVEDARRSIEPDHTVQSVVESMSLGQLQQEHNFIIDTIVNIEMQGEKSGLNYQRVLDQLQSSLDAVVAGMYRDTDTWVTSGSSPPGLLSGATAGVADAEESRSIVRP